MSTKEIKEQVIQMLPYRCPYCDQTVTYDPYDLKEGENPVQCPSCRRIYIKWVPCLDGNETD